MSKVAVRFTGALGSALLAVTLLSVPAQARVDNGSGSGGGTGGVGCAYIRPGAPCR